MILDLRDMLSDAQAHRYALPVFEVAGVALARAAAEAAADLDSPVVLHPTRDADLLMPALVALAKRSAVPVAPVIGGIATADDAAAAIRLGAHGLILAEEAPAADLARLAEACNVAIIPGGARRPLRDEEVPDPGLGWFGDILDHSSSPVAQRISQSRSPLGWAEVVDLAATTARGRAAACIGRSGACGRVAKLARVCRRRREVEHVVLYNPGTDDVATQEAVLDEGVRLLGMVPGVRRVFLGRAAAADGAYRHAWIIRLAAEGVIGLLRDHPDHVAFVDRHVRPVGADRATFDFVDQRD